ncbi:LPD28 domain-containing protein [Brevibacillus sp. 179-C9.3 HS]|uniref:LPD28 domain-containing protein n=1 Tax=unclassified Brevibacillus TaxID=2684853 RepID=UPI00399F61B3
MTGWRTVTFRGKEASVFEGRIQVENRDPDLHYYDIRHSENDWGNPVSIEPSVSVNFFGILITSEPINMGPSSCLKLTFNEQRIFAY